MWLLLVLLLLWPQPAPAVQLPAPGAAATATEQRFGSIMQGYVESGCLPVVSAGLAVQLPPCRAWAHDGGPPGRLQGFAETTARSWTLAGSDGFTWLIGRHTPAVVPEGWTCLPGLHYCHKSQDTPPPLPAQTVWLARLEVKAGAVTQIDDLRPSRPDTSVVDVDAPLFGAVGDGSANDSPAITQAFANLRGQALLRGLVYDPTTSGAPLKTRAANTLQFGANKTYRCEQPIIANPPPDSTIEAYGATFHATFPGPGVLFDLNSIGDCTEPFGDICNNERFNMHWKGGLYGHTHATKTGTVLFKHYAARAFFLEETATLANVNAFETNLLLSLRDTLVVERNNWFHTNSKVGGHIWLADDTSTAQNPSYAVIRGNGFSGDVDYAIYLGRNARYRSWLIESNNFSGDAAHSKIYINSGNLEARLWSEDIWILHNHTEQFETGPIQIHLNRGASAYGFKAVTISGNRINSGEIGTWVGVTVEDCQGCQIEANDFEGHQVEDKTGINVRGALTGDISVCNNFFRPGVFLNKILLSDGATRSDVQLCPAVIPTPTSGVLTGYGAGDRHNDKTLTLDMSTIFDQFATFVLPPRGYWVNIQIKDETSAAALAETCDVALSQAAAGLNRALYCSCAGAPNHDRIGCSGFVPADANGDLYLEVDASSTGSGAGTEIMTVILQVMAVAQ